ncbi:GbsR/MarR family transcriptional regulator [Ammoniphilus sp. YIM 78166]|uniref:choline uptake/conversion transcriptional regulator CudC n=1 Tax=Ammoniphilus sp. YIM 78166 TaxID=1644106 RepID=UPI00106FF07C|nr:GbsR/MarR family transcriptional regulator [Ammoniphilus sp. YIM 78166]
MSSSPSYEESLRAAENMVIDAISETMDLYGVTPSIGRLYGILYFKQDPMTLDDMSAELGMSKPSMSTGIRALQQIHYVHKVWQKGVRKDLYLAEKDFFKTFTSFFSNMWNREIAVNQEAAERATEILTELIQDPQVPVWIHEQAKADLEQLRHSRQYYEWLRKVVHLFESKEINKLIEEQGQD